MRVIDLLNKISNNEIDIGTHIVYKDREYIFSGSYLEFIEDTYKIPMFTLDSLNEKIEIIEKDKKIDKLNAKYHSQVDKVKLANKIDEIIDYINKEDKE